MQLFRLCCCQTAFNTAVGLVLLGLAGGCQQRDSTASQETEARNVLTLTKDNFSTEVLASPQPVLVDFWATWCGPCRRVAPTIAELATEYEGKVKVGKVDVDAQTELAKQYDITAIPALLIFNQGKVAERSVGVRSKGELQAALDKVIASTGKTAASNP